eukprot:CAMPEP_0115511064 /NCGR_PEP_ID=MMETSP0271-20121206/73764_2 /TAXON_ID=71861 /ORGANISM="Scrippsiella trochoidea, Strain CCMP3099" /LENGTH=50 /DNA_ID=CAMNT_0002941105 /DNA_START=515 /DNA_END=667 /DNA_ORIENTATION=-
MAKRKLKRMQPAKPIICTLFDEIFFSSQGANAREGITSMRVAATVRMEFL